MKPITYSWVLPIKNEALSLPPLIKEIKKAMKGISFEVIAVDDASTDDTFQTLKDLGNQFLEIKIIHFAHPQGKWAALLTGISKAKGSIVVTLDADLQDDPQEIGKLLEKYQKGYEVVSGWRKKRFDPIYKVVISRLGNGLVSLLGLGHFHDLNSPYKVYKRKVLDVLPKEGTLLRFSLLFAHKYGFKVKEVPIIHKPRKYGKSKFGVVKYLRIIYDLFLIYLLFSGSGKLKKEVNPS